jgi:colanic acid biosynthesis glycosyl transferase WcaI
VTSVRSHRSLDYSLTALSSEHIPSAVEIHLQAFPEFFLTFLGPRFLREFYRSFLDDSTGVGFVACTPAGEVVGVIVGPYQPKGYFKRLLRRRWWAFSLASVNAIVKDITCVSRIARAVFYRGDFSPGPPRALLSSIAILPAVQGRGLGKSLLHAWLMDVRRRGAAGCYLTTDARANDGVNLFYQRQGWRLASSFTTPEQREMNRYVFDFEVEQSREIDSADDKAPPA